MPEWGGSWLAMGIFALVVGAISHLLFWRFFRSERAHKWTKYVATFVAGFALLGTISKSNAELADWRYNLLDARLEGSKLSILTSINNGIALQCEIRFFRSEYSPSNFDDIVRHQRAACAILRGWEATVGRHGLSDDQEIRLPFGSVSRISDRWSRQSLEEVLRSVGGYNAIAEERRALRAERETQSRDITIALYGPYVAIAALMIGLSTIAFPAARDTERPNKPARVEPRAKPRRKKP